MPKIIKQAAAISLFIAVACCFSRCKPAVRRVSRIAAQMSPRSSGMGEGKQEKLCQTLQKPDLNRHRNTFERTG
jgi:3-deoxy-D-arabino-heptulosonate 7-phosphate (DAHP) synthase class II